MCNLKQPNIWGHPNLLIRAAHIHSNKHHLPRRCTHHLLQCRDCLYSHFKARLASRTNFNSAIRQTFNSVTGRSRLLDLGVWNTLPEEITTSQSLLTLRQQLKTWLFRKSYPDIIMWTRSCLNSTINFEVVPLLRQFLIDWLIQLELNICQQSITITYRKMIMPLLYTSIISYCRSWAMARATPHERVWRCKFAIVTTYFVIYNIMNTFACGLKWHLNIYSWNGINLDFSIYRLWNFVKWNCD